MLVPTYDLLHAAQQGGYALGAFNVYNLEGACSVVNAAEQNNSPAMLQIHPAALSYAGTALHRRACVCIGNVQGHYHCEPNLDFERLALLSERVNVPLVLHGTSGLPEGMVHASIRRGIVKLNVRFARLSWVRCVNALCRIRHQISWTCSRVLLRQ
jgi:fructose/tagatose bisphosphate aldolase